jgi:regulator of replication initiation timing
MFDKLKSRIGTLESQTEQLKNELAKVASELAEMKRTLAQVLAENHFLRQERDRIIALSGIAPAFPITRQHKWPENYLAEGETRQDGL